jgi:ribonuclease E
MNHGDDERDSPPSGGGAEPGQGGAAAGQGAGPAPDGQPRRRRRGRRGGRRHRRRREGEGLGQPHFGAPTEKTAPPPEPEPSRGDASSSGPLVQAGKEASEGGERGGRRRRRRGRGRRREGETVSAPPPVTVERGIARPEESDELEEYDKDLIGDIAGSWKGAGQVELPRPHPSPPSSPPEPPAASPHHPPAAHHRPAVHPTPRSHEPAPSPHLEEDEAATDEAVAPLVGERVEPPSGKRRRRRRRRKGAPAAAEGGGAPPLVGEPVLPARGGPRAEPESEPQPMPYVGAPALEEPARRREVRAGEMGVSRRRRLSSPRAWYFGPTHWGPRATHTAEEILTPPLKKRRRKKT